MSALDDQAWHLDKRIPIALIAATVAQTVALVWWAATLSSQVSANTGAIVEIRSAKIPERMPVIELQIATMNENMKTQIAAINDSVSRLDRKLDYVLLGNQPPPRPTVQIRPQQW